MERRRNKGQIKEQSEQTIKENFTGNEQGRVAVAHPTEYQTIKGPGKSCDQSQTIAQRIQFQKYASIEYNQGNTGQSDQRAYDKSFPQFLPEKRLDNSTVSTGVVQTIRDTLEAMVISKAEFSDIK